jgi:hypothetical protein
LRAYAQYLGIDADRIVATYQFRAAAEATEPQLLDEKPDTLGGFFSGSSASKWTVIVVAALGLSGAAVAVWPGGEPPSTPGTVSPSVAAHREGFAEVSNARKDHDSVTQAVPLTDPLVRELIEEEPEVEHPLDMLLKVNEPCWLEIHADETLVIQGLMHEGFEKEIHAREEIRLWLGNAGGISIRINGKLGRALGRSGQVRKEVRITPENYTEFLLSEDETEVVPPPEGVG